VKHPFTFLSKKYGAGVQAPIHTTLEAASIDWRCATSSALKVNEISRPNFDRRFQDPAWEPASATTTKLSERE
jgi:hypothetical protein